MLTKAFEVSDLRSSTGGVRTDRPVGVAGVLKLEGADCFLARGAGDFSAAASLSGRVSADLLRTGAGLVGVEVRRCSSGEVLPLLGLLEERGRPSLGSTGDVCPLAEEALLSAGEAARGGEGGEGGAGGEGGRGSTSRRPCVTRRTWQGSWRDRKCSSVSQPPPTRTIMCRPFSNCHINTKLVIFNTILYAITSHRLY